MNKINGFLSYLYMNYMQISTFSEMMEGIFNLLDTNIDLDIHGRKNLKKEEI